MEFGYVPDTGDVPLVADMSSTILSRPIDVSQFGLIYAGAQKNMGPAGLCLVVVRDDLIGRARPSTPSVWDYAAMAETGSMLNTPPTFGIYLLGLILRWLEGRGGLAAMGARNRAKAEKLYAAIDGSDFYGNPVSPDARSWMNVPFLLADGGRDQTFLAEADGRRAGQPGRSPLRRRHASQHLQRDAHGGRRRPDRLHEGLRAPPRLSRARPTP